MKKKIRNEIRGEKERYGRGGGKEILIERNGKKWRDK